jgi:hypothetical protein
MGAGLATLFGLLAATTRLELRRVDGGSGGSILLGRGGRGGGGDRQRRAHGDEGEETEDGFHDGISMKPRPRLIKEIRANGH